ncbi:hypothetical protein JDV09_22510, partial [Mycobacterium sp. Y57]|uniref:hypothetical protein n=1 Tax=Mycolicibacterium xanthum TaxID=2796469 RepID=UPI001C85C091
MTAQTADCRAIVVRDLVIGSGLEFDDRGTTVSSVCPAGGGDSVPPLGPFLSEGWGVVAVVGLVSGWAGQGLGYVVGGLLAGFALGFFAHGWAW